MMELMNTVRSCISQSIENANFDNCPFPHFYLENIFPHQFYEALIDHLPEIDSYERITESGRVTIDSAGRYENRFVIDLSRGTTDYLDASIQPFWRAFLEWFASLDFALELLRHFGPFVKQRFGEELPYLQFSSDIQLVRDFTSYGLGPHTDALHKVAVLIFYLARDKTQPMLGTSIYKPRNPEFVSEGGRHFSYDHFYLVKTIPYVPNSVLGFVKTSNSFHGVEPILQPGVQRDLIQFSLIWRE